MVKKIIHDPSDPSYSLRTIEQWRTEFDLYNSAPHAPDKAASTNDPTLPTVGEITDKGLKLYKAKRTSEGRKADKGQIRMENDQAGTS